MDVLQGVVEIFSAAEIKNDVDKGHKDLDTIFDARKTSRVIREIVKRREILSELQGAI
jgi:ribosome maturation protein Sdo1